MEQQTKKRALVSVYDKSGIRELALRLSGAGWEILSTGGTSRYLRDNDIPVVDVSSVTGFPECLDGRVKTLHPAIHAGLLARRDIRSHRETLDALGIGTIDLVCVNLYPFFEKARAGLSLEETIEFIDIGGPAMLRSAAKNYRDVIVLTDPADYGEAAGGLANGVIGAGFRKRLAGKVFALTSAYDAAVARYLLELDDSRDEAEDTTGGAANRLAEPGAGAAKYPEFWPLPLTKARDLRYGENGHQSAALYLSAGRPGALGEMEQLNGKELGYNNIRDLDLAWKAACAFRPDDDLSRLGLPDPARGCPACCVAVKHNTPCGIALGATLAEAYEKAYACDPVSIYGGIVASTVRVDSATAAKLAELFLEIVAAPDYDEEALGILKAKKNLRVIKARREPSDKTECIAVDGGLLVQDTDKKFVEKWEVVTKAAPDPADIQDMLFGMKAVTFVKSNAIVVVRDRAAVGIGGGQTNRIWAAEQALSRAGALAGGPARVLASDAFFPFGDVAEAAAASGIRAIVQPGGSIRDGESIEVCDKHGLAMVFTGTRHFKH
ncbi:MAG: bifunctional phosphoribosylaminoimidazolecarboxamide formyltransferase/IMP cyclohydrolase [Treponema sp.]|jgi:phosphoribosylaminoimidazolecarboxamide formyltransferase/IMP cyclohydrolase|nr:bifunctional phosphoribosylaminoimidazolecarboxamide formyltransferase/IMP cyclohydrolase [Treponema sp.]